MADPAKPSSGSTRWRPRVRRALQVLAVLGLIGVALASSSAAVNAQSDPATEELIARYAPILVLKEQETACDTDGEPYEAGPVDLVLGDQSVVLRRNEPGQPVVLTGPTAEDLADLDETYYLDLPGNPLRPGCGYERASRERMRLWSPTANVHLAREEDRDGFAIQYWLFYYYNDFNNTHEGDWEMVQVVFDVDTVQEALQTDPVEVGFAQHGGGEWAAWDDAKLDRRDTHPVVYVARGSHASQFDSAVYLGWGEDGTGFGCDNTDGPSLEVAVQPRLVADDTGDPAGDAPWTTYEGRWGERETWEFNGPRGPNVKSTWQEPLSWQEGLRDSSLAVPLVDTLGPSPTKVFCQITAASGELFRLWADQRWLAAAVVGLGLAGVLALLALSWRTLRAALGLYARAFPVFLPAAAAVVVVGVGTALTWRLGDALFNLGVLADRAEAWTVFVFVLGLAQHVVGLAVIAPGTVYAAAEVRAGRRPRFADTLEATRRHLGRMVRSLARPALVVAVLGLVPFGFIPAAYQYVRWLFIPQAVMLDEANGGDARAASVRTVRGRWLRTAGLAAILTGLVAIPSPLVGILLLVVAARSLEFVNLASSLVYALVYPFVFVAATLYYLDRRG
jgi:hypothetical protein